MYFEGGESDEAEEGDVGFFITNSETAVFLELAEEHLDTATPAINHFVVNDLDLAVFASGDNRNIVVRAEFLTMIVAVIPHVFNDITANNLGRKRIGHGDVGNIAARKLAFDNAVVRCDGKMQFGGYARTVLAPRAVPPFEPPP